jgi:hypothetical protein
MKSPASLLSLAKGGAGIVPPAQLHPHIRARIP